MNKLNVKQFKKRFIRGLVEPDLFKLPVEDDKKLRQCLIQPKSYSLYDIENEVWSGEYYVGASFVIVNMYNKIVYIYKNYSYNVPVSLVAGKYKIKFISSYNCKINESWQEFVVKDIDERQTFSFFLERQDFYKVNVRVKKDEVIPSIILQNKDESKRRSEIVEAYGKGIVYNDYYNYFTEELVFSTPVFNATQISQYDLGYSETYTDNISTNALLWGMPFCSWYFKVNNKDISNNLIQTSEIIAEGCETEYYSQRYIDNQSVIYNISTNEDGTNSITRYSVTVAALGTGRTYRYNSRINIEITYPQEREVKGYLYSNVLSMLKQTNLSTFLQCAYNSDFSNENYNGYYSAIYLPYDENGNCKISDATTINNLDQYQQLIQEYGDMYDSSRFFVNKQRVIPDKIINSDTFKNIKNWGNINSINYGATYKLLLPNGELYEFTAYPEIITDSITNEEYFYDSTTITQYSEDYGYWINQ